VRPGKGPYPILLIGGREGSLPREEKERAIFSKEEERTLTYLLEGVTKGGIRVREKTYSKARAKSLARAYSLASYSISSLALR